MPDGFMVVVLLLVVAAARIAEARLYFERW
jgi:hypothetical protein